MPWGLVASCTAALLIGGAAGAGLGASAAGDTDTTRTVVWTQFDTVTETTTVKKRIVKTVTEPPPDDLYEGDPYDGETYDDSSADDADGDGCSDSYEGACVDPYDGYTDLDCPDVYETDFSSVGDDPYGFDADYDAIACES